jgi:hypothetical protein
MTGNPEIERPDADSAGSDLVSERQRIYSLG